MRIGITGPIGSGKSCVATSIERLGYPVYGADAVAKRLASTDAKLRCEIVDLLGEKAYTEYGAYDRAWVASRVFADRSLLAQLNALIHPAVFADYAHWCQMHASARWLFFESALLPHLNWRPHLDVIMVVMAPEAVRIGRIMRRDGSTRSEAQARMAAQGRDCDYEQIADFTITNVGLPEQLAEQVESVLRAMEERYG